MASRKNRSNAVGQMAFLDNSPISPVIRSPIPFPGSAVSKRVVIERPAPDPVRRTCPICGAIFDDYTQRWNTLYDRTTCRVKASEIKRDTAMETLSECMGVPADLVDEMFYADGGLKRLESMLNERGYRRDVWQKAWVK